jgi:hypothetical protein
MEASTTTGNNGGNKDNDGTIEVHLEIDFDDWPEETSWFLIEKRRLRAVKMMTKKVVLVGPSFSPQPFQNWKQPL